MSGIAGVVHLDGAPATRTELDAMAERMVRRGPDRQAVLAAGSAGFVHALLATTPESACEVQPWQAPDGCIVVADSRLDNRAELLRALGIDRHVDQIGDGELLHAAWCRWGTGLADRLRGDFALAVWSPSAQSLYLARDALGVRPLAWHYAAGQRLVFGSQADVVLAQGQVPPDLDEGRIADALLITTEGIDATSTFYRAIRRLPAAHWLLLRNGKVQSERYWFPVRDRPAGLPDNTDSAAWAEAQRDYLTRAVHRRQRSQRPVGAMLSGGLDSSSVVAIGARRAHALPVFAATNPSDADCLETQAIRAVLANRNVDLHEVDLPSFASSDDASLGWWRQAGEPFDATMSLTAALYQAAARAGVASVMDGVPADNLYVTGHYVSRLIRQGHPRQAWAAALAQWRLPGIRHPLLRAMQVMVGAITPAPVHAARQWRQDRKAYLEMLRSSLIADDLAHRVDLWGRYRRYRAGIGGSHQWHPDQDALSSTQAAYIAAGLERYNRVASLHGVEPRPPYTDRELVEFNAWVPIRLRTRDGHRKWLLRDAMAGLLPDPVRWRSDKSHIGYRFSQAAFDRGQARGWFDPDAQLAGWVDPVRWRQAIQDESPGASASGQVLVAQVLLGSV